MAKILVVTASGKGSVLRGLLEHAGHDVALAASFQNAVTYLAEEAPDVLATDVRLGAFNGLHLLIRHHDSHPKMRVIVMGPTYDPVLAYEATIRGATYIAAGADDPELVGLVTSLVGDNSPARRWPRKKPIAPLVVQITDHTAQVLDLSYGGMRFETSEAAELPALLKIVFPDSGVAIEAHPVWRQASAVGSWLYGAEISGLGQSAQQAWRQLVDTVPARA